MEQWQQGVSNAIGSLHTTVEAVRARQEKLSDDFAALGRDNERQHGELKSEVAGITTTITAMLEAANKSLDAKSKVIRGLVMVVIALLMFIAGVKAHALGLIKDLGF